VILTTIFCHIPPQFGLLWAGRMSGLRYYNKQACRKWKTMLVK